MGEKLTGNWELLFPSLYLRGCDLQGKDVTLTISHLDRQTVLGRDGESKVKVVLHFEEMIERAKSEHNPDSEKRLIMNKTNMRSVSKVYGPEMGNWTGKRITLYPKHGEWFGEERDALRIRERIPAEKEKKS